MGRRPKQTFFQRGHSDANKHMRKTLSIVNHQRNQKHNEISLHTCRNGYHQKEHKQQMLARMQRKGNHCIPLVGMLIGTVTEKQYGGFSKNLKLEIPYNPVIPLLGIYPKKMKTLIQKDMCTPVSMATLFTIAKIQKQPR